MKTLKFLSIIVALLFIAPSFTSCASGPTVAYNGKSKASKHRAKGTSCRSAHKTMVKRGNWSKGRH